MPIDPVCKMEIEEHEAADTQEYKGKTYFFCSETCRDQFDNNPVRYADQAA